jgi:hypothetical protein
MKAPIIVTVYNRLDEFQQCIEHLKRCHLAKESVLYISSDGPFIDEHMLSITLVRDYIQTIEGFKEIIKVFHSENKGLNYCYQHIISNVLKRYDRFIFLEDDVIVGKDFLEFMNNGLDFYLNNPKVVSISAFSHSVFYQDEIKNKQNEVYFTNRWCPWGFATWKNKFEEINTFEKTVYKKNLRNNDFNLKLNQIGEDLLPILKYYSNSNLEPVLDLLYCYNMVKNDLYTCTPYQTKSLNIGNNGKGTRTKRSNLFMDLSNNSIKDVIPTKFSELSTKRIRNDFNYRINHNRLNLIKQVLTKIGFIHLAYTILNFWKK